MNDRVDDAQKTAIVRGMRHRARLRTRSLRLRWRWFNHLVLAAVAAAATLSGVQISTAAPAHAAGLYQLLGEGLDSCAAPSTGQMAHFWNGTPYYYWGIYIGGDERGCSQANLTKGWIATVTNGTADGVQMNWKLLPIWVGPQDPCQSGFGHYISTNTTTAFDQGESEGASAYEEWVTTLGQSASTPIEYDMEYNGDTITSTCLTAMHYFIDGWVTQLHLPPAQKAGLYTSTGGDLNSFATISSPPDFIDGANYSSGKSTADMPGVSSSHWSHQQRHKQYRGPHNETWNGTTLSVDNRCANSWVYATFTVQNTSEGCS
jgi:hypothetical protein